MIDRVLFLVTLFATLGSALIAGAFFAFSSFVMQALARLPAAHGIAAMQSINVVVINPWFLGVFVGTAAVCVLLAVSALLTWHEPGAMPLLTGALLYFFGTFVVTMAFNVPRNNLLAATKPDGTDAASVWLNYVSTWTAWNHVRTVAALAATALLIVAMLYRCRLP